MTAAGPSAKRPPHIALELSLRALIACLLGLAVLIGGCDRQSPGSGQAGPRLDTNAANAVAGQSPDEVTGGDTAGVAKPGTIDRSHKGEAAPAATFLGPANRPVSLADFRGKPVLVNLWATWCAPCVKEMPTLDALAQSGAVKVVAVSQDLEGAAKVDPFFQAHGFKALQPYLDPKLGLSTALQANLPTTILYDSTGHELWRVMGGYDWTSAEARKLIAQTA
ncbi:MAG TPA: TlpA disulfide reductase family protein [Sphingomonas sp.]|nr:TlpA disulfide reductase family protein [Sphingomonas sp.]